MNNDQGFYYSKSVMSIILGLKLYDLILMLSLDLITHNFTDFCCILQIVHVFFMYFINTLKKRKIKNKDRMHIY